MRCQKCKFHGWPEDLRRPRFGALQACSDIGRLKISSSAAWWLVGVLCLAGVELAGSAGPDGTPCVYFGRGSTTNGDRIVKSTCPPPLNQGVYYFKFDFDPGTASETLKGASLVSPADAVCDEAKEQCTSIAGPGYDLYVSNGCLPVPGAPGLLELANSGGSTRKTIKLNGGSYERFYIAAVRREGIEYGAAGCSLAIYPGFMGKGQGQRCFIVDYTPNTTITTSKITTTVTTTTFNSLTNRTENATTSSVAVEQSTGTAKLGETAGTDFNSNTQTIFKVLTNQGPYQNITITLSGVLTTTVSTTIHTSTVLTSAPENIEFCKPTSPPLPPAYVAATVVLSSLVALFCLWQLKRREQRRSVRRMCVEQEERFRHAVHERTIRHDMAIDENAFDISELVLSRSARNSNASTTWPNIHKSDASGAPSILVDNWMRHQEKNKELAATELAVAAKAKATPGSDGAMSMSYRPDVHDADRRPLQSLYSHSSTARHEATLHSSTQRTSEDKGPVPGQDAFKPYGS